MMVMWLRDFALTARAQQEVMAVAGRAWPHAELAARQVVEAARAAHARDDCTAVIAFLGAHDPA
jgi:hypothetical protein